MSRAIDANKLKKEFDPEKWKDCEFSPEAVRYIIDHAPTMDVVNKETRGVYECFHCGAYAVLWDSDWDFQDFGYVEEGIVQKCHCENCGAQIVYYILDEEE